MKKDEQLGVSRRSFLKGAGLAAAAMAGTAALAGCANESAGGADTLANTGDWLPQTWDYECDLLVIGYGGAGMWASLIGADECGQQVLVLEKAPERGGGNSSINNGEWTIVEEADKERFKDYIRAFTKGKTPDPMIEAWVEECARNTEYADKYGMTYEVVEQALAGAIPEYFFLDDNAYEGSCKLSSVDGFGMLSFHELDAQREALGVEVLFDCHDERLIQNPQTKEIVGAYTMIGNEEKTVKARKAVIMTLGGFEFNEELKNQYLKCSPFKFEGWRFNTGDGIKMVEDVGAKLWHMDMAISMYSMWTRDPEYDFSILYFMPGFSYFNVNRLGKRFVNENNMGSPHNGWHTLLSFDDSIADFDHSLLGHLRPELLRRRQAVHQPGRLLRVRQLRQRPARFRARLGRLEPGQQGRAGARLDPHRCHHRGAGPEDQGVRSADGCGHPEGHLRGVPGLRRRRQGRALRPRRRDHGAAR